MALNPTSLAFRAARPLSLRRQADPRSYIQACRSIVSSAVAAPTPLRPRTSQRQTLFITADISTTTTTTTRGTRTKPCPPTRRRLFSHSAIRRATVVLQNPRVDDDGNEMTIEISERAAKRLKQITSAPPQKNTLTQSSTSSGSENQHLRVTVTSGGCHGFQYLMSLEDASKIDPEEDTVFSFAAEKNTTKEEKGVGQGQGQGQAKVVMDQPSLELLKGSTVDFTTELIGSQFKIVGNPRATSSCGCGTSFDIE
ncbi:hypothetical protein ABEF95_013700 [Exophiala dermatitidis]